MDKIDLFVAMRAFWVNAASGVLPEPGSEAKKNMNGALQQTIG